MSTKLSDKKPCESNQLIQFAAQRTVLAYERNSMAAIRTGFSSFALGFALLGLLEDKFFYITTAWLLLILGCVFLLIGFVYYPFIKNKIKKTEFDLHNSS